MAETLLCSLQDEFTCSLCVDTLTDPVTIPCGHNFCLKCLTDCWDESQECCCPQCRHTFTTRPELNRNTLLNEVISKLKKTTINPPSSQNYAGPEDVECDFCARKKFRAVKSCLTCLASYCQTHLQSHYEGDALKHHKLTDPDGNLKEKLCGKHQKSLEIFCKTDETCICMMCVVTGHNSHKMVELEMEREEKNKQLVVTLSEIRRRLEERKKILEETKKAVEQMKILVEKEVEEHEKSFTVLIHCIEETRRKVTERIREQEMREMEEAERIMEQLEKEIVELKKKDAELKELSETKDHVHFLQTFSSHCVLPADADLLSFTVTANFSYEDLRKELLCLKKSLEKISQGGIMTLTPSGSESPIFALLSPEPQSREEFLQYFCPLTLDINTAHRLLRLSEGNKKARRERRVIRYSDYPDRFDWFTQVLCREALTGTRYYWEVECSGDCVLIGVAYKGLSRKGKVDESRLGFNDKSWSLWWSNSFYLACHKKKMTVIMTPFSPRRGVYLDSLAGTLSFYSVLDKMTLLHRFNTSYTEPLYPGFYIGPDCSVAICHLMPSDN
ncbi:E3 ubiquitin/ISG15 ligase TRIM25-like [Polypterus senegalus]|uniref:E3 ubiquitin/ISG15 ligase TRIM25-like n=1 Tax=Polypterus senegalus TaxID=55291 RepID=UPI0019649E45|nr:E3 ubiquitin/ISG15 ligase TRIM25-like [Polypterus senegalus]